MRLICPNCGAQYEVPADVIPEAGRDVQCSNCGHTWFESPGASLAAEEGALDRPVRDETAEYTEDHRPETPPEPAVPVDPPAVDEDEDEDDGLRPAPRRGTARPQLDASVAEILREEAEREERNRRAEARANAERQEDLPLAAPAPAVPAMTQEDEARDRMARLRGEDPDAPPRRGLEAAVAATVASSRKELLPDIEEINTTLRSDEERPPVEPLPEEVEERERKGFRRGFLTVLTVIILLCLVYLFADLIASQVPGLDGTLEGYVATVDDLRLWLDARVQGLIASLEAAGDT